MNIRELFQNKKITNCKKGIVTVITSHHLFNHFRSSQTIVKTNNYKFKYIYVIYVNNK